ncbi:hypothetical protein FOC1_g10001152 [Fusarium oxysporum f. sp. cubense race 1]|uniref:Uncharacterized protein n=1 Tax=Fusarium oxysporum f. sp. cubense (strain race 1) TaxID=1229664 RepID=N4UB36_FUSC1|nr:hypothetical protein FOC1_g10001152 [Fusarium oxysporum f. sp. cubense race 1]
MDFPTANSEHLVLREMRAGPIGQRRGKCAAISLECLSSQMHETFRLMCLCLPKQEYRASLMEKRRAASSKSTTFTLYRRSAQYPDVQTCDFSSYADEVIEDIHKLRPCLPCQWLGTKCTDVDPSGTCGTCRVLFNKELQFDVLRALVDKKLQSDALSSIYCIRLLFKDMKLYQSDYSDPELLSRTSYLESSEIHLEFEVVGTTLESLVETARVWLAKTDDHSMSMVGLLSSKKFSDLAESFLGKNLVADLREFLYATSLAHVREIPDTEDQDHSTYEMRVTAAYRGRKILDYLDWILSPQSLNRASQDELRAYFLAVLLTTLGVGYSVPLQDSPALFEPMREQLCDMLSARLILIGSKLDIRFHPDIQRKLLISAVNHWGKEAYFTWSQRTTAELPMYSTLRLPLPPYPEENIYRKFGFELCRRNTASWIDKDECTCVKNCPPGRGCRFALI